MKTRQELRVSQRTVLVKYAVITTIVTVILGGAFFFFGNLAPSSDVMAGANTKSDQVCYTISDSENKLYKFNLSTGSVLDSKSLSNLSKGEASTLNLDGDTLWILNEDELHYVVVGSSLQNYKVSGSNISNQQLSGSLGNKYFDDFDAMTVDTFGNIWAGSVENNPCVLVVIDRSTGNVKEDFFGSGKDYLVVDNSNASSLRFDAMAIDPLTNKLYANMNGSSHNYDYLMEINTTNGQMEVAHYFSAIDDVEGMFFDAVGDLYVTTGANSSGSSDDKLWRVDLENGTITETMDLWGGDMETCDCVIGTPKEALEISGKVYYDEDEDATLDAEEMGQACYKVSLYEDQNHNGEYDSNQDDLIDTMLTYADGDYKFRVAQQNGKKSYLVTASKINLPAYSYFTTDSVLGMTFHKGGLVSANNNFGFSTDSTNSFNCIEGTVFSDYDSDGTLDAGEHGISGAKVKLWKDKNKNGTVDAGDQEMMEVNVGRDGHYCFRMKYEPEAASNSGDTTISVRVSSDNDDAAEKGNGDMKRSEDKLKIGNYHVGMRFRNIGIPQGATISSAKITFVSAKDKNGSVSVSIYGEDTDDASSFSNSDDDITDRTSTSETVSWSFSNDWDKDETYETPDLKTIVQEIVDRGGWSSGNDMVFILSKNSGKREAVAHDDEEDEAPILEISYEVNNGGGSAPATTDNYLVSVEDETLPTNTSLTTVEEHDVEFDAGGMESTSNDFGAGGGAALPVDLIYFEGEKADDHHILTWSTATEINNDRFEIQRRIDDEGEWEVIDEILGHGTTNTIQHYTYEDYDVDYDGRYYYRLKQIDFDGQFEYSDMVVISDETKKLVVELKIGPNPCRDYIILQGSFDHGTVAEIVDQSGLVVKTNFLKGDLRAHQIRTSELRKGVYFLRVGQSTAKFIKI
jgi:hypothetical protein